MGKIIRRTVTITITETWTIVWTDDGGVDDSRREDEPQDQAKAIVPEHIEIQEEADEGLRTTLTTADPGDPSLGNSTTSLAAEAELDTA